VVHFGEELVELGDALARPKFVRQRVGLSLVWSSHVQTRTVQIRLERFRSLALTYTKRSGFRCK
jgi:hypothetical protein